MDRFMVNVDERVLFYAEIETWNVKLKPELLRKQTWR